MDRDVVLNKLENLRHCIQRIEAKTPTSPELLVKDYDLQDIISVNLERAIQTCVDIGLHVISDLEVPVPQTMAETFMVLERAGSLDKAVAERMAKSVGFRNIAVHAYQQIDWTIVYRIITEHLDDFRDFARQILKIIG
ncbi:MAG: DUF86 domain-containing protein [Lentisphaerae bacterium]|jgi:uncharacterized protein YutE (UPF0331/DUF86 family)|nr:DUF86 domain-containing protein [Lentisphaerota bacterium]